MARIPQYVAQERLARIDPRSIAAADTSRAGAAIAAGFAREGERLRQMQEEDERNDAVLTVSNATNEWSQALLEREEAAEPGAPGFYDAFEADFNRFSTETVSNAPESQRAWVEQRLSVLSGRLFDRASRFQAGARRDKAASDLEETVATFANRVRSSPLEFRGLQVELGELIAQSAIADMDKEEARRNADQALAQSYLRAIGDDNPYELRKRLNEGEFDTTLEASQKETLLDEADRGIRSREAEARALRQELREESRVAIEAVAKGRAYPEMDALIRRARGIGDTETLRALETSGNLASEAQTFAQMSIEEQNGRLAELKEAGVRNASDNDRLDLLENLQKHTITQLAQRPRAYAISVGLVEDAPMDFSSPDALAQSFERRIREGRFIQEHFQLSEMPIFNKTEAAALKTALDDGSVAERVSLLGALYAGTGTHFPAALKGLAVESVPYAIAGAAMQDGAGGQATAIRIMRGADVRKSEADIYMPKGKTETAAMRDAMVDYLPFEAMRGFRPDYANGIREAIFDSYADRAKEAGVTDQTFKADLFQQAVTDVVGGVVEWQNGGGVNVEVAGIRVGAGNDRSYVFPPLRGMTESQFDDLMDSLTDEDLAAGGFRPMLGDSPMTVEQLRGFGVLVNLGNGRYSVEVGGLKVGNEAGTDYVLDLRRVAGGGGATFGSTAPGPNPSTTGRGAVPNMETVP